MELHHEFRGQGLTGFQSENLNHLSMLAGGTSCCSLLFLLRVVRRFTIGSAVIRRVYININDPYVEEPAALLEFLFTVTIGQKAIVADSHEALRQDVGEEAANEFDRGQRHHTSAATVRVVFPEEGDISVVHGDQAAVGDGNPVSVASEVLQDLRGPT